MNRFYHFLSKSLLILCISAMLFACSKINQAHFDKIKPNMTMKEVISILGEPTQSDSINILGISGTTAVWKDNNGEIDIQFLNDRVTIKVLSNLDTHKPQIN